MLIVSLLTLSLMIFLVYRLLPELSITGFATTASQIGNLTVGVQTLVACTWPNAVFNVTFGDNQDPGVSDVNATRNWDYNLSWYGQPNFVHTMNWTSYNVTVDSTTNVQTNVTMRGRHFLSGANIIGVTNVTWWSNQTRGNGTNFGVSNSINLTDTFNTGYPVGGLLTGGGSAWWRFWLDIPSSQTAGQYVGNFTQQCAQGN